MYNISNHNINRYKWKNIFACAIMENFKQENKVLRNKYEDPKINTSFSFKPKVAVVCLIYHGINVTVNLCLWKRQILWT